MLLRGGLLMADQPGFWRACSSCKKNIGFQQKYFECSVSSCQGKRTGYVFCSVICWERHLPGAKHRDAGAVEKFSPSLQVYLASDEHNQTSVANNASTPSTPHSNNQVQPQRRIIPTPSNVHASTNHHHQEEEVLVVVSKLKAYIKDSADMNTSGDVSEVLSKMIRRVCDEAVRHAQADGRKTVMARDFKI